MKIKLNEDWKLEISPENETENYLLNHFLIEFMDNVTSIIINKNICCQNFAEIRNSYGKMILENKKDKYGN